MSNLDAVSFLLLFIYNLFAVKFFKDWSYIPAMAQNQNLIQSNLLALFVASLHVVVGSCLKLEVVHSRVGVGQYLQHQEHLYRHAYCFKS